MVNVGANIAVNCVCVGKSCMLVGEGRECASVISFLNRGLHLHHHIDSLTVAVSAEAIVSSPPFFKKKGRPMFHVK